MNYSVKTMSLILLLSLLFSCSEKKPASKRRPKLVKYEHVGFSQQENLSTYNGTTQQELVIHLSFRSNGTITKLPIKLGQRVKKGELLAVLDNVSSRLAYEQSVTQRNVARSNLNTTKSSLDRIGNLYEKGSASLNDFEQAKNAFKTAQENYEAAKRTVAIRQDQVNYGYIYAPRDGIIAAINVEINENISAGEPIATLNAGDGMEIVVGVPENGINNIHEGDAVTVHLPALEDTIFKAVVIEVSPALSEQSSTYPVRVALENPTPEIKSGMAAKVDFFPIGKKRTDIEDDVLPSRLVIPAQAVGEDYEGRFVFLIVEKDSALMVKRQKIVVGKLTGNGFEIEMGIKKGDRIATAGLQTLLDGQNVRLD